MFLVVADHEQKLGLIESPVVIRYLSEMQPQISRDCQDGLQSEDKEDFS